MDWKLIGDIKNCFCGAGKPEILINQPVVDFYDGGHGGGNIKMNGSVIKCKRCRLKAFDCFCAEDKKAVKIWNQKVEQHKKEFKEFFDKKDNYFFIRDLNNLICKHNAFISGKICIIANGKEINVINDISPGSYLFDQIRTQV